MNAALLFPLIELFAVMLFLLMLHWLRKRIGLLPYLILLCLFFLFSQLTLVPEVIAFLNVPGPLGSLFRTFLLIPVVCQFLLIYEEEGTMETQRLIFGCITATLAFVYLIQLVSSQFDNTDPTNVPSAIITILQNEKIFQRPFLFSALLHICLLTLLPVSYQFLRNRRLPFSILLFFHALLFLLLDNFFLFWYVRPQCQVPPQVLWEMPPIFWASGLLTLLLICGTMDGYLRFLGKRPQPQRTPFGILSSLLMHLQTTARMQQTVEEWADRYQAVFDNTADMIFLLDQTGRVINANHAAFHRIGKRLHSKEYPLPPSIHDEKENPLDWSRAWADIWEQDTPHQPGKSFSNHLLVLEDNSVRNVDFTLSPARLNDNALAVLIMHDITDRRQAELQRQAHEEQRIHSQRLEAIGILAGGVAHDFNNLLQGIQASTDILEKENFSDEGYAMLQNIRSAEERASDLTSKLLGFARKGKYDPRRLNIIAVSHKAADLFNIGHKDLTFRLLAEPGPLNVQGDETQLQQVLLNLLLNARDALRPGTTAERKVTLRIDRARADMPQWNNHPEHAGSPENYVILRVKDNGSGISEEAQKHIFDPFYTTKGNNGTGLGLSMAYGCIANHHGWIHVQSRLDVGTEISIFLPLAKDVQETSQTPG